MLLEIDHLVIAVPDPDEAVETLAADLGMSPGGGGSHGRWGTRNRLLWLGDTYIELLGIDDPLLAAVSWLGAPAMALIPFGAGPVSWAISTDSLDRDAADLRAGGLDLGPPIDGERQRPDGRIVTWRLALPTAIALDRPFLIWHDPSGAEWAPTDRATRAASPGRLTRLDLPIAHLPGFGLEVGGSMSIGLQVVGMLGEGATQPILHISGCGSPRQFSRFGCFWSIEEGRRAVGNA